MTIYLILHTLLQQYKCIADCGDTGTSGDHQLNPQVFFPNSGGDSGGNQNCGPSTGSGYQNYNSGQQSSTSGQPSTGYQPNQAYSQPVAYGVLPQQYQSGGGGNGGNGGNGNGGRRGPLVCDNTAEREAFKKCVSDALRSLKNILENCKRELGENAQECNLSDDCLAKLTGKDKGTCNGGGSGSGGGSGNRNNSYGECSDDDDDSYSSRRPRKRNRRSRNNDSYGSTDSLEEFIKYLESRLCEKDGDNGGRKSSPRRKKSRRSYRDEDSIDDTRSRRRRSQKGRRRKSKKKDSCSDVCEENM